MNVSAWVCVCYTFGQAVAYKKKGLVWIIWDNPEKMRWGGGEMEKSGWLFLVHW